MQFNQAAFPEGSKGHAGLCGNPRCQALAIGMRKRHKGHRPFCRSHGITAGVSSADLDALEGAAETDVPVHQADPTPQRVTVQLSSDQDAPAVNYPQLFLVFAGCAAVAGLAIACGLARTGVAVPFITTIVNL